MGDLEETVRAQVLRSSALKILRGFSGSGCSKQMITLALQKYGYSLSEEEILDILLYLEGKGLLRRELFTNRALGIGREVLYITAAGIDVLEGSCEVPGIEAGI